MERFSIAWTRCALALVLAGPSAFGAGIDDGIEEVAMARGLRLGPVAGWTTAWHPAPQKCLAPLGETLEFGMSIPPGGSVSWSGALPLGVFGNESRATCTLSLPGLHAVVATVTGAGGSTSAHACVLYAIDLAPGDMVLGAPVASVEPHGLHAGSTNEETVAAFFDPQPFAELFEPWPGQYVTSVERELHAIVAVAPAGISPLVEWRADGLPIGLGATLTHRFDAPGSHALAAGPPGHEVLVAVDTYEASVVSPVPNPIPDGVPLTIVGATDPPGYEAYLCWMTSTLYGTATPVVATGPSVVVQFDDTWGADPTLGDALDFQWLGFKVGTWSVGQDPPRCCFFCDCEAGTVECLQDVRPEECPATHTYRNGECETSPCGAECFPCDVTLEGGDACRGDDTELALTVENTGTCTATFSWMVTQTGGDVPLTLGAGSTGSATIAGGAEHQTTVTITVPDGASGSTAELEVKVTGPGGSTCEEDATVGVPMAECNVTLTGAVACDDTEVQLTLTVENIGDCDETFDFLVANLGGDDFDVTLGADAMGELEVAMGATEQATVTVGVPDGIAAGEVAQLTVSATGPTGQCENEATVTVMDRACTITIGGATGCPGDELHLPLDLENTGPCELEMSWCIANLGGDGFDVLFLAGDTGDVTLGPGQVHQTSLVVVIPADAPTGGQALLEGLVFTPETLCGTFSSVNVYGVQCMASLQPGEGCPGDKKLFDYTITNSGACPAEYTWQIENTFSDDFDLVLLGGATGMAMLEPGDSVNGAVFVEFPSDAGFEKCATLLLRVFSGSQVCTDDAEYCTPAAEDCDCTILLDASTGTYSPIVGEFSPLADPHVDGRLFLDTEVGGEILGAKDIQSCILEVQVSADGQDPDDFEVRWQAFDPDDPADHVDVDPNDGGSPTGGTPAGGDNRDTHPEGVNAFFLFAFHALSPGPNPGSDPNQPDQPIGTAYTVLDEDFRSSVKFRAGDEGGDNYRIVAACIRKSTDEVEDSDESGIFTMWRKRFLRVDSMTKPQDDVDGSPLPGCVDPGMNVHIDTYLQTGDVYDFETIIAGPDGDCDTAPNDGGTAFYPGLAIGNVEESFRDSFASPDPNRACYIDFVVTDGQLMTEYEPFPDLPALQTYVQDHTDYHGGVGGSVHAANSYHLIGMRRLTVPMSGEVFGTNRITPHCYVNLRLHYQAFANHASVDPDEEIDHTDVHELGHALLKTNTPIHTGHSMPPEFDVCCGGIEAGQGILWCPMHAVEHRQNVTREWPAHDPTDPAPDESERDSD